MATKYPVVSSTDEERTTVDPGALDSWSDEKTIAEVAETGATDVSPDDHEASVVVNRALGSESENQTVDELTIEQRQSELIAAMKRPDDQALASLPAAELLVQTGPIEGQRFHLTKPLTTLGRALANDIVIADRSVSKKHLTIEWDGKGFFIQDLNSGNGTIINGRDEDNRYKLMNSDAVELGRSIITFECAAMSVKKPTLEPPKPRGKGNPSAPPSRPTLPMRSGAHPVFDANLDDEASTVAGQRSPGPGELPVASSSTARPRSRAGKNGQDLIMPRDVRATAAPRKTVSSPAVPAPRNVMPSRNAPLRAVPSAPVMLDDDEEPTMASSSRRLVPTSQPVPRPISPSQSGPVPVSARRTSLQPNAAASPRRAGASSSGFPRTPVRTPMRSSAPPIQYPTAPRSFTHGGAAGALSPRGAQHAGIILPSQRKAGHKWIAILVLLAVATVVGVTIAAISGDPSPATNTPAVAAGTTDEPENNGTDNPKADDPPPTTSGTIVSGIKVDAATNPATVQTNPTTNPTTDPSPATGPVKNQPPLPRSAFGTSETVLASLPPVTKPIIGKPPGTENIEPTLVDPKKPPKNVVQDKIQDNKQELKSLVARANAAYRDRAFSRAATLTNNAAKLASKRERRRLKTRASGLRDLQKLMSSAQSGNPVVALNNFFRAKRADRKVGGKHQAFINAQIRVVGPKAAGSYMSAKDYPAAARAVTQSQGAGVSSGLGRVIESLEKRAKVVMKSAGKAENKGDNEEARSLLLKAKSMVPPSSKLYGDIKERLRDLD